jgi:membrane-bound lytic murein transglycosylase D
MVKLVAVTALAVLICGVNPSVGGGWQDERAKQVMSWAEGHYREGERAFAGGEYDRARREFDQAVDLILMSGLDVRADPELRVYYRNLIERINRYQVASFEQGAGFSQQRYEPSPLDKIASLSEAELEQEGMSEEDPNGSKFNFKFSFAPPVRQFINYFAHGRGRDMLQVGLQRSARYRLMAERIFKEEGVPTDLIWMAQIESGWNPYALSSAGAKGIWQFIPSTALRFGLWQDYWIDERSNPEKSTRAAARYLRWLADRYGGNWELALAAYNAGERAIDSAIARAGSHDFWQLRGGGYIPQETRNYVPAILAVIAIAKNPNLYGLEIPPAIPYHYQVRAVVKQTDLRSLARKLGISHGALAELNPELHRGVTPPRKHLIRIPASHLNQAGQE